ncbi:MAG: DNA translocase FtsK 4TM domain-containing protein [Thermoanaerobaculia bacterium]|nr:DNA translocase FtsK 4TM domain-containing protein [Thermoanaerobaculia bacterium]
MAETSRKPEVPHRRRDEFLGILVLAAGLLLLAALFSYDPVDPSLFSSVADPDARPGNWAGRVGASFADGALQFFGFAAFVLPLVVLALGAARFRSRALGAWGTKALGLSVVLLTASPLCHLAFGRPQLLGGSLGAGGFVGDLVAGAFVAALNPPGAAIALSAGLLIGVLLVASLSLGDALRRTFLRASASWAVWKVERERRRQTEEKERTRRAVVQKHLERARETPPAEAEEEEEGGEVVPIPSLAALRVRERSGSGQFSVRRAAAGPGVSGAEVSAGGAPSPASPSRPSPVARPAQLKRVEAPPQRVLPFPSPKESNGWIFPPEKLLRPAPKRDRDKTREEFQQTMELIAAKCLEFGVEGVVDSYRPGPVVTTYEFKPSAGVKVAQVSGLENDLALALAAEKVRIERIPGRAAIGIEVPNRNRDLISLREIVESEKFKRSPSLLTIALGIDVEGTPVVADLARMPHLLVAGMTGAGKSVGVNGMITSILYKARPDEVKFIFVDPKMNDMKDYDDLPHLLVPVVVDPKKAANALKWAVDEMEGRYKLLSEWPGVRNIEQYNAAIRDPEALAEVREKLGEKLKADGPDGTISPMPYIVVVIDELADLMMTAPKDIEESVARLAQKARAVGIHLILATQRPSVDVITGTIKANLPCRISYTTRTKIDARTILDATGAEAILGQGDMLFLPPGPSYLQRVHGGYVSGEEIKEICRFLKKQAKPIYDESVTADRDPVMEGNGRGGKAGADDADPMYDQAARLVVRERMASISFLQRRLEIGFSRAGKLIDMMQRDGIVGPPSGGAKSRDVLVPPDYYDDVDRQPR